MKKIKLNFFRDGGAPWTSNLYKELGVFGDYNAHIREDILEYRALVRSQMVENLAMEVRKGGKIRQKTNN